MWRDALLVAGKDLRVEVRSRVGLNQVVPFAVLVLVLFAFALDPEQDVLVRAAAGLFWIAVLLATLLAVPRSRHPASGSSQNVRSTIQPTGTRTFLARTTSRGWRSTRLPHYSVRKGPSN